jgi:hypothetical protein
MPFFYNLGGLSQRHHALTGEVRTVLADFLEPKGKPSVDYQVSVTPLVGRKTKNTGDGIPSGRYHIAVKVGDRSAIPSTVEYLLVINGWKPTVERHQKDHPPHHR